MQSVGALILFSILGAAICAKARVAGGAIVFSLIALVLFVSTPAGSGLPGAISGFLSTVDGAATPALTGQPSETAKPGPRDGGGGERPAAPAGPARPTRNLPREDQR